MAPACRRRGLASLVVGAPDCIVTSVIELSREPGPDEAASTQISHAATKQGALGPPCE